MMNNYTGKAGAYAADVHVASSRAGPFAVTVAAGWLAFPFAVQTVLHPTDAIWLQLKLQGVGVPHQFTAQQATVGFVEAVFALCVLVMFQMMCTVLFYRRVKMEGGPVAAPVLWPVAALLAGVLGNAAWFLGTGAFDLGGCIVGLSSAALTVGGEILCNILGQDFVFGGANSPQPVQNLYQFPVA